MPPRKPGDTRPPPPVVRYAPLTELPVYEITEAELDALAGGPPGQLHLSFALALLPAALTILVTLQTVEIKDDRVYYAYLIAFWVLLVQGLVSLARWWTANRSFGSLVGRIRARMPERPGVPEQVPPPRSPDLPPG